MYIRRLVRLDLADLDWPLYHCAMVDEPGTRFEKNGSIKVHCGVRRH